MIVAATTSGGIGREGSLPWRLPKEMQYFAKATAGSTVVMGRKTWDGIPLKFRPLKGRTNIVVSRSTSVEGMEEAEDTQLVHSLDEAIRRIDRSKAFLIGGAQLYTEALRSSLVDRILLTRVFTDFDCDTFIPAIDEDHGWRRETSEDLDAFVGFEVARGRQTEKDVEYEFQSWVRR